MVWHRHATLRGPVSRVAEAVKPTAGTTKPGIGITSVARAHNRQRNGSRGECTAPGGCPTWGNRREGAGARGHFVPDSRRIAWILCNEKPGRNGPSPPTSAADSPESDSLLATAIITDQPKRVRRVRVRRLRWRARAHRVPLGHRRCTGGCFRNSPTIAQDAAAALLSDSCVDRHQASAASSSQTPRPGNLRASGHG